MKSSTVKINIIERTPQLESNQCQIQISLTQLTLTKNPNIKPKKTDFFFFLAYPMSTKKRRVIITEEILEESFEIETNASTMEMSEAIYDGLRVFFSGLLLSLHFHEEPSQMRSSHDVIFRVLFEEGFDLRRRLRQRELEAPPPAEAHTVCLFRHDGDSVVLCECSLPLPTTQRYACVCVEFNVVVGAMIGEGIDPSTDDQFVVTVQLNKCVDLRVSL